MAIKDLIEDMYVEMEYMERNVDTMSFEELSIMIKNFDFHYKMALGKHAYTYLDDETKSSLTSVLVHAYAFKKRFDSKVMNIRVCLA